MASRAFAYAGLTLYEAVVPGMPGYRSLGRLFPGLDGVPEERGEGYDWEAAANAALAAIFRNLIPTAGAAELEALDALEATFDRRLSRDLSHRVRSRSRQRGAMWLTRSSRGRKGTAATRATSETSRRTSPRWALVSGRPHRPGSLGSPADLGVEPDVRDRRRNGLSARRPSAVLGRARVPVPA